MDAEQQAHLAQQRTLLASMSAEEKLLWRAKLDAGAAEDVAEDQLKAARRQLTAARRARRKADQAFESTATGAQWIANIRREVSRSFPATLNSKRQTLNSEQQPTAAAA